jgi:endonuclease/exonuclease/phosphatase family metal-dependent hydrolase
MPIHRLPLRTVVLGLALPAVATAGLLSARAPSPAHRPAQPDVTVMSYNLYLGAKLESLITANPATLPTEVRAVWNHMERLDFPARAAAVAGVIDRSGADVVGLQEVALWERGATPRTLVPTYDYLTILLGQLAARGDHYRAVSISRDFESPVVPISGGGDVRFTERSVVLVRTDASPAPLVITDPRNARYTAGIPLPPPLFRDGVLRRGWASVDIRMGSTSFRLIDTHLEAFSESVRVQEAAELSRLVRSSPLPVVVVGDLNVAPNTHDAGYRILTSGTGLRDAWAVVHGPRGGVTDPQPPELDQYRSTLARRVDYVLFQPAHVGALRAEVAGDQQQDRTLPLPGAPYGLWPSDHAAIVATLRLGVG